MELRNCPECGRVFVYTFVNLCPECRRRDEEEFNKVKEYLYDHPETSLFDLAQATEVDETKITRWIREGRLLGKQYPGLFIPCERCGKPISEGRFCSACSEELAKGFTKGKNDSRDLLEEADYKKKVKFHTRDK